MYIVNYRRRAEAAFLLFCFFFFLSIARLCFIQFFRSEYLAEIAQKQHNMFIELEPRRGTVYDCNLKPLAVNLVFESVYAEPNQLSREQKERIAAQLAPLLALERSFLASRLDRDKAFVWLARKVSPEQAQQIRALKFKGIGMIKESKRCYPNDYLLSQVLGFAGLDNTGLEGLELYYDNYLKGEPGWATVLRDARSKRLDLNDTTVPAKDGYHLVLTIDEVVQYIAERELEKAYQTYHAKGASIIVIDPRTGQLLALANRPGYDLNKPGHVSKDQIRNRAICDMFEPGSVFKIVTAAAALEENKVNEMTRFFCENGEYRVANHTLHDHRPHGWLTFREVIEQSSNIGTSKVAQLLGPDKLYEYIKRFGFGAKLGIDIPGEINGSIKPPRQWSKTSIACVPMGQEVGVTALQLATALSVIANGGYLMKPYLVREVRDRQGQVIDYYPPTLVRQVLSEETAARMRKILIGVMENGTGKMGKLGQFTAGGKTGTAQKLDPNGSYSHDKYIASFMGFAPAEDPQVAIVVTVDEPHPYYFGGVVAAPVFKRVAEDVLKYLKTKEYTQQTASLK